MRIKFLIVIIVIIEHNFPALWKGRRFCSGNRIGINSLQNVSREDGWTYLVALPRRTGKQILFHPAFDSPIKSIKDTNISVRA